MLPRKRHSNTWWLGRVCNPTTVMFPDPKRKTSCYICTRIASMVLILSYIHIASALYNGIVNGNMSNWNWRTWMHHNYICKYLNFVFCNSYVYNFVYTDINFRLDTDALFCFIFYRVLIHGFSKCCQCQGRQFGTHRFAEPSSRAGCHWRVCHGGVGVLVGKRRMGVKG